MQPKIEIIGDAELAAPYIEWAKHEWSKQESARSFKHVGDCLIEFIKDGESGLIRFFPEANSGFITHPRTGSLENLSINSGEVVIPVIAGGWSLTGSALTKLITKYPYPLIDSDNASLLVSQDKTAVSLLGGESNYGNYYLINSDEIISWKGSPNRHAQFSSGFSIPGIDTSTRSYSGFTEKIYSGGMLIGTGPLVDEIFGFIYALAFFENKYVAVIKTQVGFGLWTSTNITNAATWENLIEVTDVLPDFPWWFDFSGGFIKAVSSRGDVLTAGGLELAATAQLVISISPGAPYTINGVNDILFEGSVYSSIATSYTSGINISGDYTISDDTKLITRTEFLPDSVQITGYGGLFCASLVNSEGESFNCSPCTTEVSWGGPVKPVDGTSCAELESDCYPPGENEVEITATVTCGNLSATGSITVTIMGSAGYWGKGPCIYSYTYSAGQDADGCITWIEYGETFCVDYNRDQTYYSSATFEIVGNMRYVYVAGEGTKWISGCPCACAPTNGWAGTNGGINTLESSATNTIHYNTYEQDGETLYYCGSGGQNSCTTTRENYSVTHAPFAIEPWVCL